MQFGAKLTRVSWTALIERLERASPVALRAYIYLVVTLVMLGLITHGNYAGSGDAVHYMVIARSIAFDLDVDVGNDYGDPSNIIKEPAGSHARIGRNGVLRPVHDIGLPLVAAPFFAGAYRLAEMTNRLPGWLLRRAKLDEFIALRQLVGVFMILVTGALAVSFFEASWHVTGQKASAFIWAIIWALSPPILTHGYVFLTEVPSALVALLVYARRDDVLGDSPSRRGLLLGLLTGFLFLIHVRNLGLILALGLLIAWRVRRAPKRGLGFGVGLAIMGVIKIALNVHFWGSGLTTPHEHLGVWLGTTAFLSEVAIRSLGLLFDARHGLLVSAPIYLLAPAAWFVLRRRSRVAGNELLLLVVAYLVFVMMPITNIHGWRGGWSPAARFLVPIAPFLALAVPLLLIERNSSRVVAALVFLQLLLDAFFWAHPMLLWSEGPGPAPFLEALIGRSLAAIVPVWEGLDGRVLLTSLAGLGIWAALTWIIVRVASLAPRSRTSLS
jgi:hypothetical protein